MCEMDACTPLHLSELLLTGEQKDYSYFLLYCLGI
jgi:hypothetical protein